MKSIQNNQLTEKQMNIVLSEKYPQYVRAGAGTGKTEVLINKILCILKTDKSVNLSNFGIITFTNKAAEELRVRLSNAIYDEWLSSDTDNNDYLRGQAELVNMIEIGTIHNFCENIIREYGVQNAIPTNFKIKSFRKEMMQILDETIVKEYQNEILKDIPQYKIIKLLDALLTNNYNYGIILDDDCASECLKNNPVNDFWCRFKKHTLKCI